MRKYTKKGRVANMPENKTVRTSMRLPVDLWNDARIEAIKRNLNAQDIVAEGLRLYFKKVGAK